jgi:hypothetical protein
MKILALLLILTPFLHNAQKNTIITKHANLSFDYLKKDLTDVVKDEIDSIWDMIKNGSEAEFHLLSKEEKKKLPNNQKYRLTSMRSDSVLAYLHRKRIAPQYTSIKTKYFDDSRKTQFASSNASYKSMVEKKGVISVVAEKDTYSRKFFQQSESSLLSSTCNDFTIYPATEQVIYGEQGTVVRFPANCFSTQGLESVEKIEITLCEYYTMQDILLSGLTTTSEDKIIETGGAIYIEARFKEKVLHLKTDHPIEIFFPTQGSELKNGMKPFEGKSKDGLIDWNAQINGDVKKVKEGTALFTATEDFDDSSDWENEEESEEGYYSETDGYLMKVGKMGFINCDRFYDFPVNTELIVSVDSDVKMSYRLVFEDIKSVLPGYEYSPEGFMKFSNLPKGKQAIVIAFSISKKTKQAKFAYARVKLGEHKKVHLIVKSLGVSDLQKELSVLF